MKERNIKQIVDKLIGEIKPIGSSEYDSQCLENIEEYIELFDTMFFDLLEIAKDKNSPFSSVSKVGHRSNESMSMIKDVLSEERI